MGEWSMTCVSVLQLHARSEFIDYDDVDLRRHLLR
jgi:hypothetical protein